jgi:hypothetical protein
MHYNPTGDFAVFSLAKIGVAPRDIFPVFIVRLYRPLVGFRDIVEGLLLILAFTDNTGKVCCANAEPHVFWVQIYAATKDSIGTVVLYPTTRIH